jgi:hypothetical protein
VSDSLTSYRRAWTVRFIGRDDIGATVGPAVDGDPEALKWLAVGKKLMGMIAGPEPGRPICGCCDRIFDRRRVPEIFARVEPLHHTGPPMLAVGICADCVADVQGDLEQLHLRLVPYLRQVLPSYQPHGRISEAGTA